MRNDRDVIDGMAQALSSLGLYMVLVFFAAQFVAFFRWSNLGTICAVAGAEMLKSWNLTGPEVFLAFILMCCFVNLMLGSASAQWAVTAPIFVPMLMSIGYSPQVIQAAYRSGRRAPRRVSAESGLAHANPPRDFLDACRPGKELRGLATDAAPRSDCQPSLYGLAAVAPQVRRSDNMLRQCG